MKTIIICILISPPTVFGIVYFGDESLWSFLILGFAFGIMDATYNYRNK